MTANRFLPLLRRLIAQSDGSRSARMAIYDRVRDQFGGIAERLGAPIDEREAAGLVDELQSAIDHIERVQPITASAAPPSEPDPVLIQSPAIDAPQHREFDWPEQQGVQARARAFDHKPSRPAHASDNVLLPDISTVKPLSKAQFQSNRRDLGPLAVIMIVAAAAILAGIIVWLAASR